MLTTNDSGLVTYAAAGRKLTIPGICAGVVVALIHMASYASFFWLLMVFFLLGTVVTKVRDALSDVVQTGGSERIAAFRGARM